MDTSAAEHSTAFPWTCVEAIAPIQYVNGETRYMKIQKPGSAVGVCMTPQKVNDIAKSRVTIAPAVSVSGRAAMTMCAKVEA